VSDLQDAQPYPLSASAKESLVRFLKQNRDEAMTEWLAAVRSIPAAALLDQDELRDHMPVLIDRLINLVSAPSADAVGELPELHALLRMREGFNLEQVAWEYSALRSAFFRLNDVASEKNKLHPSALVLLNDAIDQAVVRAVSRYHQARVRMLEALDRIAHEGLVAEPQPLDTLLHRLLSVIVATVREVDTAIIFLREWDRLVARAAIGLERGVVGKFSLAMGEGFAGAVAQSRTPLMTRSASTDARVQNPVLRLHGVKALYGVPLIYGDEVIGVAKMGSTVLDDFLIEDRHILRSAADRASAFIAQRRESENRELLMHILGHDLRSPLNTIVLAADRAKSSGVLVGAEARSIDLIRSAAWRMDRLIGDLTDYTQARTTGRLPLQREDVDVCELVSQVAGEFQGTSRQVRFECAAPISGYWDRSRILRAVVNLVNNAFAYGNPSAPVTVRVEADESSVTLRVHNHGDPIPSDLVPQLFEPFKRGTRGEGSGLGLYIVHQIARAHGGRVEVESSATDGTTFSMHLRRAA
jgi:signal transduction histidine kinase